MVHEHHQSFFFFEEVRGNAHQGQILSSLALWGKLVGVRTERVLKKCNIWNTLYLIPQTT